MRAQQTSSLATGSLLCGTCCHRHISAHKSVPTWQCNERQRMPKAHSLTNHIYQHHQPCAHPVRWKQLTCTSWVPLLTLGGLFEYWHTSEYPSCMITNPTNDGHERCAHPRRQAGREWAMQTGPDGLEHHNPSVLAYQIPLSYTNTQTVLSRPFTTNARTASPKFQTGPWHVPQPNSRFSFHIIAWPSAWVATSTCWHASLPYDHAIETSPRPTRLYGLMCASTCRVVANIARVPASSTFVVVDLCKQQHHHTHTYSWFTRHCSMMPTASAPRLQTVTGLTLQGVGRHLPEYHSCVECSGLCARPDLTAKILRHSAKGHTLTRYPNTARHVRNGEVFPCHAVSTRIRLPDISVHIVSFLRVRHFAFALLARTRVRPRFRIPDNHAQIPQWLANTRTPSLKPSPPTSLILVLP